MYPWLNWPSPNYVIFIFLKIKNQSTPVHVLSPRAMLQKKFASTQSIWFFFYLGSVFCSKQKAFIISYLQHIIVTVLVKLHIKLMDSKSDAATSCRRNIPDALLVFWIPVWVVWTVEGATGTRMLPTTTCRARLQVRWDQRVLQFE